MGEKPQSHIEVVVSATEDGRADLGRLAAELREKGLRVSRTMESLGMIAGTAPVGGLDALRKVKGVALVEASGPVQLPPPDADIQ